MKPKDLKIPFTWGESEVLLEDGVWYVPERLEDYASFRFPGWEQLFGNDHPVHVEYCSGNGLWIIEKAKENPEINWVAVEKQFKRVRKIWSKMKNEGLKNLIVVLGEGVQVTDEYFPDGSISEVYVNFPDPWPKKRHRKHRIVQPLFADQMQRILKEEGKINLVTDDADYSETMIAVFQDALGFASCYAEPFYVSEDKGYGSSWFEELWREKGRAIRYHKYQKVRSLT